MSWQRMWPHVRAVLVILHVLAVITLALPGGGIRNRARWQAANVKSDFAGWARALRSIGVDTTPERLADRTYGVAEGYVEARSVFAAPFTHYPTFSGARQGWAMFASPQRHPVELHVDVLEGGQWVPIFRSRSRRHDWMWTELDQHRMRKLVGRFAREERKDVFFRLADHLAQRALRDHPAATRARVRMFRYDTLPPERVAAGERPVGRYTESREVARPRKKP
jgi:hypothetical protein